MFQPDVIVVGAGIIGLSCATAIAREGRRILVISSAEEGSATAASAGIVAPSVGSAPPAARALGVASRDMYPEFLRSLEGRTGLHVALDRSGVLEVAFEQSDADALLTGIGSGTVWLDSHQVRALEPSLAPTTGAALHEDDGAVDSRALLNAVGADAARDRRVRIEEDRVMRVDPGRAIAVHLRSGRRIEASQVVVAAGAWASSIAGLPHKLPIEPVRGQMLSFPGPRVRHVVMGPQGYLVPRGGELLVGSTMERAGFDAGTTDEGARLLSQVARELVPALADQPVLAHWAGLRPMTPDLLPIVGAARNCPGLIYACGHSRNGVLLAPLTARVVADLVARGTTSIDVAAYAPARLGA